MRGEQAAKVTGGTGRTGERAQGTRTESRVSEYEVVIVQERYDVDPDLLTYLSSIGHRFSIVRPHLYDLINGVALRSYCAIARNQAVELAERDWVVFLSDGSDPDVAWIGDL